jgi:hypothetical protein
VFADALGLPNGAVQIVDVVQDIIEYHETERRIINLSWIDFMMAHRRAGFCFSASAAASGEMSIP